MRSQAWPRRAAASGCCRKRCGRRPRPTCGGKKPPIRLSQRTSRRRFETLTVIEAANAEEEALAIAVALREAVQDGKTAALVTPDRTLGRRVLAALGALEHRSRGFRRRRARRHAGRHFRAARRRGRAPRTGPGHAAGAAQASAAAARRAASTRRCRRHAGARDTARAASARRQRRPCPRAQNIARRPKIDLHPSDPRTASDRRRARRRRRSCRPARRCARAAGKPRPHVAAAQRARRAASRRASPRCRGKTDKTMPPSPAPTARSSPTRSTNSRRARPRPRLSVEPPDYVELFAAALADRVVRRPPQPGLRVRILGPLEARLTESDRVVLGGLVEGTWPPESRTDAWLSRPMRLELGLDLPERRIGLSAHDFAQLLGAARSDPEPRRQDRRHADRAVALHPAPRRGRRRRAGSALATAAKIISPGRASSTGPRQLRRSRSRRRSRRARHGRPAFR